MTIRIFCKGIVIAIIVCASVIGWKAAVALQRESRETAVNWQEKKYGGLSVSSLAIGHEYRQDDWPAIAAATDGSVWVAWLSFASNRDDIAIRRYHDGKWSNIHWVPNTSGDNWLPQIAVDSSNRPWVVWSQQLRGNWDLYARRFDPSAQEWGPLERLTSDP